MTPSTRSPTQRPRSKRVSFSFVQCKLIKNNPLSQKLKREVLARRRMETSNNTHLNPTNRKPLCTV